MYFLPILIVVAAVFMFGVGIALFSRTIQDFLAGEGHMNRYKAVVVAGEIRLLSKQLATLKALESCKDTDVLTA